MDFFVNTDQYARFHQWARSLGTIINGTPIGGAFTFRFTPTAIGMMIKVQHVSGEELDLSEYDKM